MGTVVAGAPHAKVPYGSFLGLTQQAYKVALSVRLLLLLFRLHIPGILHLLDDFLIVSKSLASCTNDLQVFLKTCDELGVPMAP